MDHVAILNKKWKLLPKILSEEKTIESRWYKYRFAPWDRIETGDRIFFKDAGEKITVKADVSKVLQFDNLDYDKSCEILKQYSKQIGFERSEPGEFQREKNYCILIFLEKVEKLRTPFKIDKTGYGNACAWMCVEDIDKIRLKK